MLATSFDATFVLRGKIQLKPLKCSGASPQTWMRIILSVTYLEFPKPHAHEKSWLQHWTWLEAPGFTPG
jgi:hypothetical protein